MGKKSKNVMKLKLRLEDAALLLRNGELTLIADIPNDDTPIDDDLAVLSGMMVAFEDPDFRRVMLSMLATDMKNAGFHTSVH